MQEILFEFSFYLEKEIMILWFMENGVQEKWLTIYSFYENNRMIKAKQLWTGESDIKYLTTI